jgi:hypothetical protein
MESEDSHNDLHESKTIDETLSNEDKTSQSNEKRHDNNSPSMILETIEEENKGESNRKVLS